MNKPVIDMVLTGQNISTLRKQSGYSVRDLADLLDMPAVNPVYKWEKGMTLPSIDNLVLLASVLNTTLDNIIITR